jgi:peptidoglycan/LPS O-acetylase OafA/YrhL
VGLAIPHKNVAQLFYTSPLLLEFAFGLGLGVWHLSARRAPAWLGWAMLAAGFGLLATLEATPATRLFAWGLPAAMVVAGALVLEKAKAAPQIPLLGFLGDASYSIYIVHAVVFIALSAVWGRLPFTDLPGAPLAFAPACLILGVGVGIATHLMVEKPLLRATRRRRLDPPLRAAEAAA